MYFTLVPEVFSRLITYNAIHCTFVFRPIPCSKTWTIQQLGCRSFKRLTLVNILNISH